MPLIHERSPFCYWGQKKNSWTLVFRVTHKTMLSCFSFVQSSVFMDSSRFYFGSSFSFFFGSFAIVIVKEKESRGTRQPWRTNKLYSTMRRPTTRVPGDFSKFKQRDCVSHFIIRVLFGHHRRKKIILRRFCAKSLPPEWWDGTDGDGKIYISLLLTIHEKGTECISAEGYGPGGHYGSTLTKQWRRTVDLLESGFGFTVSSVWLGIKHRKAFSSHGTSL